MELEYKHIAPYLPHKLWCVDDKGNRMRVNTGLDDDYDVRKHGLLTYVAVIKRQYKPILKPMSDLFKVIDKDSSNPPLTPYQKLDKIFNDNGDYNSKLQNDMLYLSQWVDNYNVSFTHLSYLIISKLFEWRFDVFGLINKGLAVSNHNINLDITKLNTKNKNIIN